ncbi:hypothetical protein [Actinacidiphila rubida]|uniref:hypothetical protein n=1 Tax=Actinacidiphila rubida TaxID=310780 RepID=UPI00114CDD53|nr:hypothetical protein [Actinacidiphila rubida]
MLPLRVVVERMCPHCAVYGSWGRTGTAVGLFLQALTGMGLLYELGRYAGPDEDTRSEDDLRAAAAVLHRVASWAPADTGELDDDDDEGEDWRTLREAQDERVVVFDQWRAAAGSLHRAHRLLAPFAWLRPWAEGPMRDKAAYLALLQQQAAQLVSRDALVAAAHVAGMPDPVLPSEDPALTPLGSPEKVAGQLRSLWRRWSGQVSGSWEHPRWHRYLAHNLVEEMGARRKGRDGVLDRARELVAAWTATATAQVPADCKAAPGDAQALIVSLREPRRDGRDTSFLDDLSQWELGVLAIWGGEVDWESLEVTLQAPGPVAAHLASGGSALSCQPLHEAGVKPVVGPELLVEPGVFDDAPISDRRPVAAGHLRALRALAADADQLYLVVSLANGPQVLSLAALEHRVAAGDQVVIIAAAADLPEQVLPGDSAPIEEPGSPESGSVWPDRVEDPTHPDFGRSLGAQEGELVVARLSRRFSGPSGSRAALRSLVLARAVPDLRELEGTHDQYGTRRGAFPHQVWHGLLAMEQLRLKPFMPDDASLGSRSGSGLPLGVLARVQLYTTDGSGRFEGRAHSPGCAHQRGDNGLTRDYDLVTVEEMLNNEQFDPCSKCGGYATRRLTAPQLAYYRAAYQGHSLGRSLRRAAANPAAAGDTARLAADAKKWLHHAPADEWFTSEHQVYRWHRFLRALRQQAQKLE